MNTGIKIPTLLGIGILLVGLIGTVFLVNQNQLVIFQTRAVKSSEPKNITLVNLSGNSAAVYWQTDDESPGFIEAGPGPSLGLTFGDTRDQGTPKPHKLHFATLTNLSPNTTYYYKIISGTNSYPSQPLSFKTPELIQNFPNSPLIGQVVDENLQPVNEALINLTIPGAQHLATITKLSGNFILPLTSLYAQEMNKNFDLSLNTHATLTIFNEEKSSRVSLKLPFIQTSLPQIILGQDLNLLPLESSNSASLKNDLNGDGIINSMDRGIILKNFGKKGKNILGDLNQDEIVDQKDVDILNKVSN